MRMSRRERWIFSSGKKCGYSEGYAQGYHDGNPLNVNIDAISHLAVTLNEKMKDPEFAEQIRLMQEQGDLYDGILEIEEGDE